MEKNGSETDREKGKKPVWLIWMYLIPLYVLVAYPIARWVAKVNRGDVTLTSEQSAAFNSTQTYRTAARPPLKPSGTFPRLNETAYSVSYRKKGVQGKKAKTAGTARPAGSSKKNRRRPLAGKESSLWKDREIKTAGYTKGFLTYAVGYAMNRPSAVKKLFDNSLVIRGFMQRPTVKRALSDPQALQEFLTQSPAVSNFLGNSVVQKALGNPAILNAVASSKLVGSLLDSPAIQQWLSDPEMLELLIESNPQAAELLANPILINALVSNPSTRELYSQLSDLQQQQQ